MLEVLLWGALERETDLPFRDMITKPWVCIKGVPLSSGWYTLVVHPVFCGYTDESSESQQVYSFSPSTWGLLMFGVKTCADSFLKRGLQVVYLKN